MKQKDKKKKDEKKKKRKKRHKYGITPFVELVGYGGEEGHDFFVTYEKGNRRVETRLIPAPWSHVLLLAFMNAIAISVVKLAWYHYIGKPDIVPVSETTRIEARESLTKPS